MAWLVLPACVSFFFVNRYLNEHYPMAGYFSPARPENLMFLRNVSFMGLLVFTLASIPRWQSFVGIAALVAFFLFFGG